MNEDVRDADDLPIVDLAEPGLWQDPAAALAEARDAGDRLSPAECEAMAINLLFAGHDTTRGLLSFGLAALLRSDPSVEVLRERPEAIPDAVEEMLRIEPPVLGSLRAPAEAIDEGRFRLPAGRPIHFLFPASSRDPRVHDEPDRFRLDRKGARAISFGLGPHACLGAGLARMEAQEVVRGLLTRTRRVELLETPRFVPFATIRRLESGFRLTLRSR